MTPLEKEIEKKLVNLVRSYGGLCLKWVCPGWAGVPDRICLLPMGRVVFVETKRPKGGRISSRQLWWSTKLCRLGFNPYFIWSHADLDYFKAHEIEKTTVSEETI